MANSALYARAFALVALALLLLALAGCNPDEPSTSPTPTPTAEAPSELTRIEVVDTQGNAYPLDVEIPLTRQEMAIGLMDRESMPEDQGMLFLLGSSHSGFWMKDTLLPLSVAFISKEGVIQHIEDMQPQTLTVHNTPKPYLYGLEVNQGWFEERGLKEGDTVRFPWPYDSPPKSPWEFP